MASKVKVADKGCELQGSSESCCRTETPLARVHLYVLANMNTVLAAREALPGSAAEEEITVFEIESYWFSPLESACCEGLCLLACFLQTLLGYFPALERQEAVLDDGFGGITANALCMPQSAAGGLTPGIPSLQYHQVALKYIFHWGSRITSVCPAAQRRLRITGINYTQHDSDRLLLASQHLVVILHLTVGDFSALCNPTKSNTNSTQLFCMIFTVKLSIRFVFLGIWTI